MDTTDHHRRLTFLKLGGSLLTEKSREATARPAVIERLAQEIGAAMRAEPQLQLLLGHGSGSFGHPPAEHYRTREGVKTAEQWRGFLQVWRRANALHRMLMDGLEGADLPAISFPPSSSVITKHGEVSTLSAGPIEAALTSGQLPVVMGDVVFDTEIGGTILSTEQVFLALAPLLRPSRILIAGAESGVYAQYPAQGEPLGEVKESDLKTIALMGSEHTDVTGGMADKVKQAFALLKIDPTLEIRIFSAEGQGTLQAALLGDPLGTHLRP